MAFPRLNALGYWLYLFGGIMMLGGFVTKDGAAKFGWYGYTPLSDGVRSPNVGGDLWIVGIALSGVAGVLTARQRHRHRVHDARAGHDDVPHADLHLEHVRHQPARC